MATQKKSQPKRKLYEPEEDFLKRTSNEKNQEDRIQELEDKIEQLLAPVSIDSVFDQLPIADEINLLSRLSLRLHGKITSEIEKKKAEIGILENRKDVIEYNASKLAQGKVFKIN